MPAQSIVSSTAEVWDFIENRQMFYEIQSMVFESHFYLYDIQNFKLLDVVNPGASRQIIILHCQIKITYVRLPFILEVRF